MEEENNYRMKSAMVLYSLERALGDFVRCQHSSDPDVEKCGTLSKISKREEISKELPIRQKIEESIVASYFEEILGLATEVSKGTSAHEHMKALSALLAALEAFTIRNSISHPNREFPDCYWYRVAAIAADPLIDKLSLNDVKGALQAAEEGKITPPPEDWLVATNSYIPNNLPDEFEHEHTGLIGRRDEKKSLLTSLQGGRYHLVSVIAPGGLGKTALALDALRECSLDPSSREWCDGIAFISLKQEKLTANGIEKLTAVGTIDELKEEISEALSALFPSADFENFDDALGALKDQKVLLCIDNLETLLRDNPNIFEDFYEILPTHWRVLITSRVTVDGAKSLTLGSLNEGGARSLIYKYFSSKGLEAPVEIDIKKIIKNSLCNPLAIRLTIDRYAHGFALVNASAQVDKDIVAFSYKNLIETLSDNSMMVLECLFVRDRFSRGELIEYLNLDADEVAEAVMALTSTSLAKRENATDDEQISLSPSVRDLLREHPKNIKIRDQVRRKIDQQAREIRKHHSIQRQHRFSPYHEDYIPSDTPRNLSAILVRSIRILRSNSPSHPQVVAALDRLAELTTNYEDSRLAHQTLARLYLLARDDYNAENHFRRAVELESDTPTSRLQLTIYLLQRENPEEALTICEELLKENWGDVTKSGGMTARRIVNNYFRSLADLHRYDDLIKAADKYINDREFRPQVLTSKSDALISISGGLHVSAPEKALDQLLSAGRLLKEIPSHNSVYRFWCSTSRHLIRETRHLLQNNHFENGHLGKVSELLQICDNCFREGGDRISPNHRKDEMIATIQTFQNALDENRNPFLKNIIWKRLTGIDKPFSERVQKLEKDGYKVLTVYKIPYTEDGPPGFVFAECAEGNRFFIIQGACINLDLIKWSKLMIGSKVAAKGILKSSGQYPKSAEVVLL